MERVAIRAVEADDRAAWEGLWTAYLAFYDVELPPAHRDAAFARLLERDPRGFGGAIAMRGGEALGLVHWLHHGHFWRPEGSVYLQDLYVAPDARGRGLARRLIETVYAAADAIGAPRVHWLTNAGNAAARRLYDRVATDSGFVSYERGDR